MGKTKEKTALDEREKKIEERELAIDIREKYLDVRESALDERAKLISEIEKEQEEMDVFLCEAIEESEKLIKYARTAFWFAVSTTAIAILLIFLA
jgi:hypothetical protein